MSKAQPFPPGALPPRVARAGSGGAGVNITTIPGPQARVESVQATVKTACANCGGGGCSRCDDGWVRIPWAEHAALQHAIGARVDVVMGFNEEVT